MSVALASLGFAARKKQSDGKFRQVTSPFYMMAKKPTSGLKPGSTAPVSGQYEIVGPRGGRTGRERTSTQGEPLPPTPKPGQTYNLVDPTRNGSG